MALGENAALRDRRSLVEEKKCAKGRTGQEYQDRLCRVHVCQPLLTHLLSDASVALRIRYAQWRERWGRSPWQTTFAACRKGGERRGASRPLPLDSGRQDSHGRRRIWITVLLLGNGSAKEEKASQEMPHVCERIRMFAVC